MLVPTTTEQEVAAYLYRFKRWLARNPDQAHLFCEHGRYHGNTPPGSFLHRCDPCKEDA